MRLAWLVLALSVAAIAENASVKVKDIPTNQDTSIVIKKGAVPDQCVQYEIVTGNEEVFGTAEYDRGKAYSSWQTACKEWRQSMREMNKDNQIISLNCNKPQAQKEEERFTFQSNGNYKMKVKIKDKQ